MPIDASVFDKIRNYSDYAQAEQDFQMRKLAAAQQLQSGGIDAASKANIYKTQLLSGAAAGGQEAYDKARTTLQTQGIDTSEFAPDVGTAGQQLQAARLAQSPLGALLNAGLKAESNTTSATAAMGNKNEAASLTPLSAALLGNGIPGLTISPQGVNPRSITPAQARALPASGIMPNGQPDNVVIPAGASAPPAPATLDTLVNSAPAPAPAMAPSPKFTPPAKDPSETLAAYNARVQQAFEAYKSDPAYVMQQKKAEKSGEIAATNAEGALQAGQMTQRLNQNLDALEKLIPDLPTSDYADPSYKAWFDKRNPLSSKTTSTAFSQFQEINQQQMINGLSELVKSGQIRGNQFIEKIISRGYMINPDDPKSAQLADIKNLKAELANINSSAQNIAGGNASYQPIPVQTSSTPVSKTDAINELRRRGKI